MSCNSQNGKCPLPCTTCKEDADAERMELKLTSNLTKTTPVMGLWHGAVVRINRRTNELRNAVSCVLAESQEQAEQAIVNITLIASDHDVLDFEVLDVVVQRVSDHVINQYLELRCLGLP